MEKFFSRVNGKTEYCSASKGNVSITPFDVLVGIETTIKTLETQAKCAFVYLCLGD